MKNSNIYSPNTFDSSITTGISSKKSAKFSFIMKVLLQGKALISVIALVLLASFANATNYYTNVAGAPETLANWWTGTAGSGTHPADFTAAGDVFYIQTGVVMTQVAAWTVAGTVNIMNGGTLARGILAFICGNLVIDGTMTNANGTSATVNGNVSGAGAIASGGTAGTTGTSGTFSAGILTGVSVTPTLAGTGMTFIVTGSTRTSTATFDVNVGALDHFAISAIASPQTAGTAITGITLTAQDAYNNTVTSFSGAGNTVTYSGTAGISGISGTFSSGVLSGVSETPSIAGIGRTFIVTGAIKTGTATFDVNAGALDHFAISTISSPQVLGIPITGITLTAQDVSNNTVSGFIGTVTYSGTAGITGTSGNFIAGVLSSVSVTPTTAGSSVTFIVTGSGITGTSIFLVIPAEAATDNFRSRTTGDWSTPATWERSADNTNWSNAVTLHPTSSAASVSIQNTHTVTISSLETCSTLTINTGATLTLTGSNTLNVSGNWTNNDTFTANSSNVIFDGSTQTITGATTFYDATIGGTGVKTITTAIFSVSHILSMESTGTLSAIPTYGPNATLQYNKAASFTAGNEWPALFGATGGIIIANVGVITMKGAGVVNSTLTINSGASLNTGNFALTFGGNFVNNNIFTAGSSAISFSGTAIQSIAGFTTTGSVSMTKSGGTATLQGNVSGGAFTLNGSGGTLDLGAGLTHTFTGTFTRTNGTLNLNSCTLNIDNTTSGTGGSWSSGTSTVNYGRAGSQTIFAVTYNNLTLSGSSTKTMTGVTTVNGNLTLNGTAIATTAADFSIGGNLAIGDGTTFVAAGYNLTVTGTTTVGGGVSGQLVINNPSGIKTYAGLVTIATGGTWNNSGNSAIDFRGGITNSGTFTAGSGVNTFSTNTQALSGTLTIPNITVTGVALTNNGTLTCATALAGSGELANAATGILNLGGTSAITTLTATAAGNTVNYSGAAQTVKTTTYNNLKLSGSGNKSMANGNAVTGILNIISSAKASLANGSDIASNSLQFGSVSQVLGTWGSSISPAAHKTDSYFDVNTSGIITNGFVPVFSNLTASQSICYGTSSVELSGTLSAGGPVYPAIGETINITINSVLQSTTITTSTGNFTISYTASAIPVSGTAYTITYAYPGSIVMATAENISTTLTVSGPLVNIGGALDAVCQGGTTTALGGSFSGIATAAVWSDGGAGGSFANNDGSTPGTTTYTSSAISASPVTLTLTTSGGSCGTASDSKQLTVNTVPVSGTLTPTPAAGAVCSGTTVSATATAGTGGAGTVADVLQYRFDGNSWTAYTSGSSISTGTHSSVEIKTYRTATGSGCTTSTPVVVSWTVNPLPVAAGSVTGASAVTQGDIDEPYSVGTISYATSYAWSYTGTGVTINGTGTDVTLDFSLSATSGLLIVKGENSCGFGTETQLEITVGVFIAAPTVYTVSGSGSYCENTTGLSVSLDNSETGVTYELWMDGSQTYITLPGNTGSSISFDDLTAGTYTIKGTNGGGSTTMDGSAIITEIPAPTVYPGPAIDIATINVAYDFPTATATNYGSLLWTKTGGTADGTLTGETTMHPVFTATNSGEANFTLTVYGNLGCDDVADNITVLFFDPQTPITWVGETSDWGYYANWTPQGVPGNITNVTIVVVGTGKLYPTITSPASCKDITIESGASLIDNGYLSVFGSTAVKRYITGGEWHLISSPVTGAVSGMFTDKYLQNHTESTNQYTDIIPTTIALTPVQGFALYDESGFEAVFSGSNAAINTGPKSFSTTKSASPGEGWNLVGNPYPSSIDWSAASGWTKTNVNNATYIHVNFETWASFVGGIGNNGGSRYIAPCQGFFVEATNAGTLGMTNAVRVNNPTVFYKNSDEDVSDFVRFQVTGKGYTDETVVRFLNEATPAFDGNYDAHKLFGDVPEAAQIYSLGSTPLAINSLPVTSIVPVGLRAGVSGTYTIAATEINNLQYVTLEDSKTGIFTELAKSGYTFNFEAGENEQRFNLHFSALSVDETTIDPANIYSYQKAVYIDLKNQQASEIFIYNQAGQLVTTVQASRGLNRVDLSQEGIYVVKVVNNKVIFNKKVWIE